MTIQENISLKEYTTFKIGGPARFFVCVNSSIELQEAFQFAKEKKLEIFFLGGGSNILIADEGFNGLVIKIEIKGIKLNKKQGSNQIEVVCGAGENWDSFVAYAVENNLYGLENLSYIPGSVGAAPVQNIGAYGVEVKDVIKWVEAVNIETGQIKTFNNSECQFAYRNSFFKTTKGKQFCIIRVAFQLTINGHINITYKDVAEYFKDSRATIPSVSEVREVVIAIRKKKLPDTEQLGTAGSFFKNPIISKALYNQLLNQYPLMPHFNVDEKTVKIPAAWILDTLCGFKGYRDGNVGVYQNQALVLINFSDASALEIKLLANKMIECVKEKTAIDLEKEVLYL